MSKKISGMLAVSILLLFIVPMDSAAQSKTKKHKGELYLSWGYNTEWYTRSTLKISQPELGNDFSFKTIKGHDHKGWDDGLFTKALSIPQYNYRLGYFFNDKRNLGVEINFDHTKFIFSDQQATIKGTYKGRAVDSSVYFSAPTGFYYYLNNGANFLLFNIVKRWHWYTNKQENLKVDAMAKGGIGPVIPHVENKFFDQPGNKPHFQLGGWNTGVEGALRATFVKHVYLELAGKLDYARYSGLQIYKGTAKHAFGTGEIILSLGVTL